MNDDKLKNFLKENEDDNLITPPNEWRDIKRDVIPKSKSLLIPSFAMAITLGVFIFVFKMQQNVDTNYELDSFLNESYSYLEVDIESGEAYF